MDNIPTGPIKRTETFTVSTEGVSGLKVYKTNGDVLEYVVDDGEFIPLFVDNLPSPENLYPELYNNKEKE